MPDPQHTRDDRFDREGLLRPEAVERIGREAVAVAIARHKSAGRSIHYTAPEYPGYVVEERPDGRRFLLSEDESGRSVTVREIPPA